jgi:hypothetical protein
MRRLQARLSRRRRSLKRATERTFTSARMNQTYPVWGFTLLTVNANVHPELKVERPQAETRAEDGIAV